MLALIGPVLGWIAIQDFRERRISLVALILLFGLGIVYAGLVFQWDELPGKILANSLFGSVILVSGTLLVRLRRSWDRVSTLIGAGDFLFLLAISPLFSFGSFLVFLNTSILLTLLLFGVKRVLFGIPKDQSIPLAGSFSICLVVFISIDQLLPISLLTEYTWLYAIEL
jgi:hypothetical protein